MELRISDSNWGKRRKAFIDRKNSIMIIVWEKYDYGKSKEQRQMRLKDILSETDRARTNHIGISKLEIINYLKSKFRLQNI